ncbi:SdrD B-like domain-containing protein [Actinophytocola sp.]|uniref:SdrD B-like domain-containing protein n=1 Tax=Actinophytocola sp. TaxID=1872138 RepID=UPI002D7F4E83|nr:SdrD B-like domain-containing protein [Actinophytocola sp.]HET9142491.1 SdrD B-like domain-containing protein [Actinophytocola sp.]
MARLVTRGAIVLITALCLGLPVAQPAAAQGDLPDLRVRVAFDRDSYVGSDRVAVTLTISNAGPVAASGVHAALSGDLVVESGWQDLNSPAGVRVEPHATLAVTLSGHLWNYLGDSVSAIARVSSDEADAAPADNEFSASARLVASTGTLAGVIFADLDADRVMDHGETGLADTSITLIDGVGGVREVTTDEAGRFGFGPLPAGRYQLRYSGPWRWVVAGLHDAMFDYAVVAPDSPQVRIPAVPQLDSSLHVSMFFDRDSYRPGGRARLTVVLANTGDTDFTGITAGCPAEAGWAGVTVGPHWGGLAAGGVTVPANGTSVFTVEAPVPDDAAAFGRFAANCAFGPAGYPASATTRGRATATVPGLPGTGRVQLVTDADGDGVIGPGDLVAGVPVVVTDPNTGAEVARLVTDADGYLAVDGLPAQVYDVRIDGPWVPIVQDGIQLPVVAGKHAVATEERWYVEPGAADQNRRPNLRVSAAFEKPDYTADERMRVRLTVTNIGTAAAEGVGEFNTGLASTLIVEDAGELSPLGPGARIEAGATREFVLEGSVSDPKGVVIVTGWLAPAAGNQIHAADDGFAAFATVRVLRGGYAGTLYGDGNGNGVADPGEALIGIPVSLSGGVPNRMYTQNTDGQGRFAFRDIPAGRYTVGFVLPDSWTVDQSELTVSGGEADPVTIRAVRTGDLRASIAFTRDSYAVGDVAHLTVRLANDGGADLTGVRARCTQIDYRNSLSSTDPGWGALIGDGPGVTVPAGASATFDVSTAVTADAYVLGFLEANCDFGFGAWARASAKVPGGIGHAGGKLIRADNRQGVAGTKMVLTEPGGGPPVARTVTDAAGHFEFRDVPAGRYDVMVVGPWKITGCVCPGVLADVDLDDYEVRVVPGAVQADPDAPPDENPPPDDPATPGPAVIATTQLAVTGFGLPAQVAGGLVLLVVGAGLRLVRRRR